MEEVFVGSEALARGGLTRGRLRWNYTQILPDVYVPKHADLTLRTRTVGAWLWSGRRFVIAGRAAAALHGAAWVDATTPIELIGRCARPPSGVVVRNERIDADEIVDIGGILATSVPRTALDLGRHLVRDEAVRNLDALAHATGVHAADALSLASRRPGARGLRRAARALHLMDAGGQSPKETWLRLLLIDAGFPRPRTQIRLSHDGFAAFIDMGWDDAMIGVDYDGERHLTDRRRYVHDIGRNEFIARRGWLNLHVLAEHSRAFIVHRVREAFTGRGWTPRLQSGS